MPKEIYINDQLVDLLEADNPVALTYAVNNLAELKDRQAYSTNNFKLPLSQRNRIACGLPDTPAFIGLPPYRKNTAKIVQNGIEILTNGIGLITETKKDISLQILSGIIGFFDLIEGRNIRDIDLSDFEHTWDLATVVASQPNTEGYIYPIIDYGSLSETDREINVRQLRPATFRHTLIERIISEAGYTFDGVVTSDERYLKSMLAFSNDRFTHGASFIDQAQRYKASAFVPSDDFYSSSDGPTGALRFPANVTDPTGSYNPANSNYTSQAILRVRVTLTFDIQVRDIFHGGATPSFNIQIQKNGVTEKEKSYAAPTEFTNYYYPNQVVTVDMDMQVGDIIVPTFEMHPAANRINAVISQGAKIDIKIIAADELVYGQDVQLESTLPDISQKDFFKDFLQMFGLMVIPNNYTKHLKLVNMQEIYENRYRALDWTDRFIDDELQIDYSFGEYGVNNYGRYREDKSVVKDTGIGNLLLDNQTLTQNVDLFTSVFAASNSALKLEDLPTAQIIKIKQPIPDPIVDGSLDFTENTEPRILMDRKKVVTIIFTDGDLNESAFTVSLPYFQEFGLPGLGYDELFTDNYPEIKRMLYRPVVEKRAALLKEADVANIDWTLPVYDKLTASYYYRNQIGDFIEGEICFVSLIKMQ